MNRVVHLLSLDGCLGALSSTDWSTFLVGGRAFDLIASLPRNEAAVGSDSYDI